MRGSFRDPAGFVFLHRGHPHRLVRPGFAAAYDALMQSGLYARAVERQLLVRHDEVAPHDLDLPEEAYRVLRPERVPFVSYPYEWCFSQLQDAALCTLELARLAYEHGMMLKDASATNVQQVGCRPVFIDTLSFDRSEPGQPWPAYYQFCKHFLAPLAVASLARDGDVARELSVHLDGFPLEGARRRLPLRSWLRPGLLVHLHLHALSERAGRLRRADRPVAPRRMSAHGVPALLEHLQATIQSLRPPRLDSEWERYDASHYAAAAEAHKAEIVERAIEECDPQVVWDLGANTGRYTRIASDRGVHGVALDADPGAVERAYVEGRAEGRSRLLPLRMDLTSPSPALGWACEERMSLAERGPADLALALALVHHLVLGHGIPFPEVASGLRKLAPALLVEWVPRSDPRVGPLLARRPEAERLYGEAQFQEAFARYFTLEQRFELRDSPRSLHLMRAKT